MGSMLPYSIHGSCGNWEMVLDISWFSSLPHVWDRLDISCHEKCSDSCRGKCLETEDPHRMAVNSASVIVRHHWNQPTSKIMTMKWHDKKAALSETGVYTHSLAHSYYFFDEEKIGKLWPPQAIQQSTGKFTIFRWFSHTSMGDFQSSHVWFREGKPKISQGGLPRSFRRNPVWHYTLW